VKLGRTSLNIGKVINVINYWLRVVQIDDTQYVKIVYKVMCTTSWAKSVRHLLQSVGFKNVWMNQSVGNVHLFIRIFKERLNDTVIRVYT